MRALMRSPGAKLFFLPKYLPDLNPIEQVFAKLKHPQSRCANRRGRLGSNRPAPAFTPNECANCFENAGYASA